MFFHSGDYLGQCILVGNVGLSAPGNNMTILGLTPGNTLDLCDVKCLLVHFSDFISNR